MRLPLILAAAAVLAQPEARDARVQKILALPLTPGSVALLVQFSSDPAAVGRLAAALRDPHPETRAAAARVVNVTLDRGLQQAVEDALASEENAEAAREEMRALAALGASAGDAKLFAAAARFDGRLDADLVDALARTRGPAAIATILMNRQLQLKPREWAQALVLAGRGSAEALAPAAASALGSGNDERWDALLTAAEARKSNVYETVVIAGLHSAVPGIAGRTAWYLTEISLRRPPEKPGELLAALEPVPAGDPDAAFCFELLARALGRAPVEDAGWIAWIGDAKVSRADKLGPGSRMLELLTPGERESLRLRYNLLHKIEPAVAQKERIRWESPAVGKTASPSLPKPSLAVRTVADLPRGVAADVLAVSGCRPSKGVIFGLAEVRYDPTGRPAHVSTAETLASHACEDAATSLFLLTLAPDREFPIADRPDILLGVARPDCVNAPDEADVCPSVCPVDRNDVFRVQGQVQAPKLKDKVEPNYPKAVRREGRQGKVVLEAVITTEGCVREVRIVEAADEALDLLAAQAVSMWKYEPALLNGRPVAVYLTVTVTFRL